MSKKYKIAVILILIILMIVSFFVFSKKEQVVENVEIEKIHEIVDIKLGEVSLKSGYFHQNFSQKQTEFYNNESEFCKYNKEKNMTNDYYACHDFHDTATIEYYQGNWRK